MEQVRPSKMVLIEKLIVFWALFATIAYFVQKATVDYTFDYTFFTEPRYEKRFEGLVEALPAIGKAFYVNVSGDTPATDAELNHLLLTRYLLAPYLSSNADTEYQVTNFHNPVDLRQWAQENRLYLINDFQNGVALFKKKATP